MDMKLRKEKSRNGPNGGRKRRKRRTKKNEKERKGTKTEQSQKRTIEKIMRRALSVGSFDSFDAAHQQVLGEQQFRSYEDKNNRGETKMKGEGKYVDENLEPNSPLICTL